MVKVLFAYLILSIPILYTNADMFLSFFCMMHGSENGDPDEECGVHAPVPISGFPRERHLLDRLRAHPLRPVHHRKKTTASTSTRQMNFGFRF